ncbi:MAG TPA: sigma-70 family RNA polymerase sigma factor [Pirellulales bacterium]|nr:sigma-70 family RNA polymerase sigma factor [Pirellulales bacterium]
MDPSEHALREAVLAGSETAWRALYEANFDALYAFVWHRAGRQTHRADEVVQETWLVAVRRIADFDPSHAPFEAWLKGIAANVLRNHLRRWKRDSRTSSLDSAQVSQTDGLSDAGERMALALTGLPARYQAVLRAKYEEKLTVNEIGQRLGSTAKAVESMLSRAREALRRAYDKLQTEE